MVGSHVKVRLGLTNHLPLDAFDSLVIPIPIPTSRAEPFPVVDVVRRRLLENHKVDGRGTPQSPTPSLEIKGESDQS